jgi:hypothetical protein
LHREAISTETRGRLAETVPPSLAHNLPMLIIEARERRFFAKKDSAMAKAEQSHQTPVVLTRRDNLKRGAAALAQRRNQTSSTMTAVASAARTNPPATASRPSRPILTPSSAHVPRDPPQTSAGTANEVGRASPLGRPFS